MKLQIGENIKIFRKTKDMTQEQLSEMLGVSCQSVSRWESGACYPDMKLLPLLSDIFEITVDRLLGVDELAEKKNVDEYLNRFQYAISCGDTKKCIAIAREGVAEYPNSYALLNKLMYALFISGDDDGNNPNWRENMQKYDGEITSLGERIMQYCPDTDIRLEATARLAFNHCEMGRREIDRKIYETLPPCDNCKELNIAPSLSDDEKLPHARNLVKKGYEMMYTGLYMMTRERLLSDEETVMVFGKIDELYSVVFDKALSPNGWSAANHHCKLAEVYTRLNRNDDAIDELSKAAEYAQKFDRRPDEITVSSLLLGEITSLGERIMQYCPDTDIRLEATARLAFNHCEMGRREIDRKIYETLPPCDNCKELNIAPSLSDDEKLPHARNLVKKGYEMMYTGLYMMTRERLLSDEETVMVFGKIDELYSVVFDKALSPNGWSAANHHCKLAEVYTRLNRNDDAIDELSKAAEYAQKFDRRPDEITVSSLLLGEITERKTDFETGDSRPMCEIMRDKWLCSKDFDSIRNTAEFKNIVKKLSK